MKFCKLLGELLEVLNQEFLLAFACLGDCYVDLWLFLFARLGRYFKLRFFLLFNFGSSLSGLLLFLGFFCCGLRLVDGLVFGCRLEMFAVLLAQKLLRRCWFI